MKSQCKWCLNKFDTIGKSKGWMANHSRWCNKNPKHIEYLQKLDKTRKQSNVDSFKNISIGVKAAWKANKYKNNGYSFLGKHHTEESKEKIRIGQLKLTYRRLRKNPILYNGILLDSKWELELAIRLDNLNIKWIRPEPLKWVDENKLTHNYFPDFYLIDYNLYLDPKNKFCYSVQKNKINILLNTYKNIRFITTLKECKEFTINL